MNPPCSGQSHAGSLDDDDDDGGGSIHPQHHHVCLSIYLSVCYLEEVLDPCGADAVDVHGISRAEVADRRDGGCDDVGR